jgi:hypothetical protein
MERRAVQWMLETLEDALSAPGRTFDLSVMNPRGAKKSVKLLTQTLI